MISVPGSPAAPFVFTMYPKDKGYELAGQGTGSKAYSDAASKEISAMSPADVQALLNETQGIAANPWPEPHMPPCKDMLPITADNLTGIWTSVDAPYQETTHYYADGSFSGRVMDHSKIAWLYSGSWKMDGHTIDRVYSFSSLDRVATGTTDNDEILGIGCGVIAFRSKDGTVGRYKLAQP